MNQSSTDTDTDQSHRDTMKRFYEAIFIGDWPGVERCVVKDLVVFEAAGLPYRGQHHGTAGLQSLFAQVVGYWENLKIEPHGITAGDGYAVGLLQFSGTSKATGKKISMLIAEVTEFRDGLIASIKPVYWDTKTLVDAMGA